MRLAKFEPGKPTLFDGSTGDPHEVTSFLASLEIYFTLTQAWGSLDDRKKVLAAASYFKKDSPAWRWILPYIGDGPQHTNGKKGAFMNSWPYFKEVLMHRFG